MSEKSHLSGLNKIIRLVLSDIWQQKWAIIAVIAYLLGSELIFHKLCPFQILTGYPCPACGLTRAGLHLLRLDFVGAFRLNLFIYPLAAFLVYAAYCRYLRQRPLPGWVKTALIGVLAAMIGYYIYRLLTVYPDTTPMTYFRPNLLRRLLHK